MRKATTAHDLDPSFGIAPSRHPVRLRDRAGRPGAAGANAWLEASVPSAWLGHLARLGRSVPAISLYGCLAVLGARAGAFFGGLGLFAELVV
jgi:hypothetical protein